jgi:arylsulfatase A-like enzyme
MHRRAFLAGLAGGAFSIRAKEAPATNFVVILADDFGWRDLACYGNPYFSTPNINRLASEGARFTNAYAACPVCSPTRASILTGKYPARTGVTDWIPGRQSDPRGPITTPHTANELKLSDTTIAERLKPAGYRSASIGKWHLGGQGYLPTDQGFDVNIGGNQSGSPPRSPKPYFGPFELPNLKAEPGEFLTDKLTEAAEAFIEQSKANPFLLYLAQYTVHIPLGARDADVARHQAKARGRYDPVYAAMVESLDESVGRVLRAIDRAGVGNRTMILFFSDNGGLRYEGKSAQPVTDNSPLRAGKGHLYEGGIREPLIVRYPGVVKPGSVIDAPVCSVDIYLTFCELAGVPPGDVDGVSLVPLLRGGSLKPRSLYWHYPHYSNQGVEPGSAIREGDWKLIEFLKDGRRELFNLRNDIGEKANLVESRPDIARRLAGALDAWRKKAGAIMPAKNSNADPNWPGFQLTGDEKPTPAAK